MLHPFLFFYMFFALFHCYVHFSQLFSLLHFFPFVSFTHFNKLLYSLYKYKGALFLREDTKILPLINTQNVETILRMQSRRESADFQLQDLIKISGFPILFA